MAAWRIRLLVLLSLFLLTVAGKKFLLVLDDDDGSSPEEEGSIASVQEELLLPLDKSSDKSSDEPSQSDSSDEWDLFPEPDESEQDEQDHGSWRAAFEHERSDNESHPYPAALRALMSAVSDADGESLDRAIKELEGEAEQGHPYAHSTLASLHGHGYGYEQSDIKAFVFHHFAAEGGNFHSKMALAYTYFRQQQYEQAVKLYAELATRAVASFVSAKDTPMVEHVRLNDGSEVSKDALKKFRGEDDDDFQFLEYQAQKGNPAAMYKMGLFYYHGLRGIRRDHKIALFWFSKAVDKGDSLSLEYLGEIYARGFGVERNYTRAFDYFKKALRERRHTAFNGLGYLYTIGKGVDQKNLTKAKEFYKKAADHGDPNGYYNLGVLYLRGAGVKKSVKLASRCFVVAANHGHPKAYYQLAMMQHRGIGMKKDLATAAGLYKLVAERGPWGSLMRKALELYLKGETGLSLLLYSRAAELGYEVAQSNAAWILEKHHEQGSCIGRAGLCTPEERHQRAQALWRSASEQGNEYAALLIGDAYFYGRGMSRDLERAAEAYMRARQQRNAQAMFNIGFMHEHGLGLPKDYHLAKRYYDQALEAEPAAFLPVYLSLALLWLRQRNEESMLVKLVDKLPEMAERSRNWIQELSLDDGNATLLTLLACLLTVLYLRSLLQRRQVEEVRPET